MNIKKYTTYFHDGSLIAIDHRGTEIIFSMWSAEIDPKEIEEELSDLRLKGRLRVEGVKAIWVDGKVFSGSLKMLNDSGDIFHFEIGKYKMEIQILWEKFSPKIETDVDFSIFQIEAEKMEWEKVTDLEDRFYPLL